MSLDSKVTVCVQRREGRGEELGGWQSTGGSVRVLLMGLGER